MAQAPGGQGGGGGGGAPRQNDTVKEFKGMNTQNRRNAIPKGSFAWLENIQPIGPGNLHSIPGRGSSVILIPPHSDCFPDAQSLEVDRVFGPQIETSIKNITRASWSYVESVGASDEIIYFADTNYPDNPERNRRLWKFHDNNTATLEISANQDPAPTPGYPSFIPFFTTLEIGTSDRHSILQTSGDGIFIYYLDTLTRVQLAGGGFGPENAGWTRHGSLLTTITTGAPAGFRWWSQWDSLTGALIQIAHYTAYSPPIEKFAVSMHDDGAFIYVLSYINGTSPLTMQVEKFNRDTLALVDSFDLGVLPSGTFYTSLFAEDANHIWLISVPSGPPSATVSVKYIKNFSTLVTVDISVAIPVGNTYGGFLFGLSVKIINQKRWLYIGGDPSATDVGRIFRIPVLC